MQEAFDPASTDLNVTLCGGDYGMNTVLGVVAGEISKHASHAKIALLDRPAGPLEPLMAQREIDRELPKRGMARQIAIVVPNFSAMLRAMKNAE